MRYSQISVLMQKAYFDSAVLILRTGVMSVLDKFKRPPDAMGRSFPRFFYPGPNASCVVSTLLKSTCTVERSTGNFTHVNSEIGLGFTDDSTNNVVECQQEVLEIPTPVEQLIRN